MANNCGLHCRYYTDVVIKWCLSNKMIVFLGLLSFCLFVSTLAMAGQRNTANRELANLRQSIAEKDSTTTPEPEATEEPTKEPTEEPTEEPTKEPTGEITEAPITEAPGNETDIDSNESNSTEIDTDPKPKSQQFKQTVIDGDKSLSENEKFMNDNNSGYEQYSNNAEEDIANSPLMQMMGYGAS